MGLGKTVQTIAFLAWLHWTREKGLESSSKVPQLRSHLIIVPASTLTNWVNEIQRFAGHFRVLVYHGSQQERYLARKQLKRDLKRHPDEVPHIILSTYSIFERSSGVDDRTFLQSLNFDYLILDEAHCLRNAETSRYQQLNRLMSGHRLLLSGTPVQNDLKELLALLRFLMPNVFRERDCALVIQMFQQSSSSDAKVTGQEAGDGVATKKGKHAKSFTKLRKMLAPFVLRRLKANVLNQLAPKISHVEYVSMTETQKRVYRDMIVRHRERRARLLRAQNESTDGRVHEANMLPENTRCRAVASRSETSLEVDERGNGAVGSMGAVGSETVRGSEGPRDLPRNGSSEESKVATECVSGDATQSAGGGDVSALVSEANGTDVGERGLPELSATEANHLFTALRKVANHPLLLRLHYQDDEVMDRITNTAYNVGYFGTQCTRDMVRTELLDMSDFELNRICLEHENQLGDLQLDSDALYESSKMIFLRRHLPELVVRAVYNIQCE